VQELNSLASRPCGDLSGEQLLRDAAWVSLGSFPVPTLGGILIVDKLSQGGMGAVYLGYNWRLKTETAIKVLPFHLANKNQVFISRFEREAQLAARLRSPHLVTVLDINRETGIALEIRRLLAAAGISVPAGKSGYFARNTISLDQLYFGSIADKYQARYGGSHPKAKKSGPAEAFR
jgi:hypothetical protein